jgi:malonyl-CoA O-methyltransferase
MKDQLKMPIRIITDKMILARRFSQAARQYDENAVLSKEIGQRLLDRLEDIKLKPKLILDLGSGTGFFSAQLRERFPKAKIIAIDIAEGMLQHAREHAQKIAKISQEEILKAKRHKKARSVFAVSDGELSTTDEKTKKNNHVIHQVCADAENLVLANQSVDLIFSNCALHWCFDVPKLFSELRRVLKPKGALYFSSFGPDTLIELRQCYQLLDEEDFSMHINPFVDMHDIGDALLKHHFEMPVMDRENLQMTFRDFSELRQDLKSLGANHVFRRTFEQLQIDISFNRKITLASLSEAYEQFRTDNGELKATFEVVYGRGFANSMEQMRSCTSLGENHYINKLNRSNNKEDDFIFRTNVVHEKNT